MRPEQAAETLIGDKIAFKRRPLLALEYRTTPCNYLISASLRVGSAFWRKERWNSRRRSLDGPL